jgi:nucleotide-binding universal stress UspA family protein
MLVAKSRIETLLADWECTEVEELDGNLLAAMLRRRQLQRKDRTAWVPDIRTEVRMSMIHKILMTTDFSECSEHALEMAIELAQREGATLTIFHACPVPAFGYATAGGLVAPAPLLFADLLAAAQRSLDHIERSLVSRGIVAEIALVEGEPRDMITRFASERAYDFIVIGSHGRRGFKRFFLGSVAEHVVRAATMPVLVVHPRLEAAIVAESA